MYLPVLKKSMGVENTGTQDQMRILNSSPNCSFAESCLQNGLMLSLLRCCAVCEMIYSKVPLLTTFMTGDENVISLITNKPIR